MGRSTIYNRITSETLISNILPENKILLDDFVEYLKSIDRSSGTIYQYTQDLKVFFVWNLENNQNKKFIDITKRDFTRFQNHAINTWNWSTARLARTKSTISSLSNFIENILDEEDEFKDYRSVVRKIESPARSVAREKSVFSEDELQKLLDTLVLQNCYRQAACVALAMYSGRRKSELLRFKTSYFSEDTTIFGSLYKTPELVTSKGRGSKGKQMYMYVLKHPFDKYLNLWMDFRKQNGIQSEWLFPNMRDSNKPMNISTLDDWSNKFTNILNKDFYWHSLRHFMTTQLVKSNVPSNVIQGLIGWESADMVNLYTDLTIDDVLGNYFDENGIKDIKHAGLSSL